LFYRLNVIDIRMPALKDHPSDIAPLVEKFIAEFSAEGKGSAKSISPDALEILEKYDWPGNVRQLKNAIEKMMVLSSGDTLTIEDVPSEIASNKATSFSQASTLADVEKAQILAALEAAGNNRTTAAASLGISRRTLHRKLKEWSIK
jgi:two-component system response regulator HydG